MPPKFVPVSDETIVNLNHVALVVNKPGGIKVILAVGDGSPVVVESEYAKAFLAEIEKLSDR